MAVSLVGRYGSPKEKLAETLDSTINAAVEFLAQKNRNNKEIAMQERRIEHDRRTSQISNLIQQYGSQIYVPPEAYEDDAALASVLQEGKRLAEVQKAALRASPQTGGSLSDFAENALAFGGVEVTANDGSIQTLNLDQSPLGLESSDLEVVDQWLNGNSYLNGIINKEYITNEEIRELERLGLLEAGLIDEDTWDKSIHGNDIAKNWDDYRVFLQQSRDFHTTESYDNLITANLEKHKANLQLLYLDPDYKGAKARVDAFSNTISTMFINPESGNYMIGGYEYENFDEFQNAHPQLAAVSVMGIRQLADNWNDIDKALRNESSSQNYPLTYHSAFVSLVNDWKLTDSLEAEYDFGPMNAMREGEIAVGLMDAMHDIQLKLDPVALSIQQRWLDSNDKNIQNAEDAQKAFNNAIIPIIQDMRRHESGIWSLDPLTGEPGPNEDMIYQMLDSYWGQIERNMGI